MGVELLIECTQATQVYQTTEPFDKQVIKPPKETPIHHADRSLPNRPLFASVQAFRSLFQNKEDCLEDEGHCKSEGKSLHP